MITILAAIGQNNELGLNNALPWHIDEDLQHFKAYTMGKVVVLGRKTFQSIGRELPGRKFIVITTQKLNNQVLCVPDVDRALSVDYCYPEIIVAGGESVYRQAMHLANKLVITHIDAAFQADSYFPEIDPTIWTPSSVKNSSDNKYNYRFVEYLRK